MNAIKAKRTQIGLSQTALAELLGVSQQAVAQWESNKAMPRKEAMVKLATLFNCTIDEFYGRDQAEQGTDELYGSDSPEPQQSSA